MNDPRVAALPARGVASGGESGARASERRCAAPSACAREAASALVAPRGSVVRCRRYGGVLRCRRDLALPPRPALLA